MARISTQAASCAYSHSHRCCRTTSLVGRLWREHAHACTHQHDQRTMQTARTRQLTLTHKHNVPLSLNSTSPATAVASRARANGGSRCDTRRAAAVTCHRTLVINRQYNAHTLDTMQQHINTSCLTNVASRITTEFMSLL
jgi:hypothetical protein